MVHMYVCMYMYMVLCIDEIHITIYNMRQCLAYAVPHKMPLPKLRFAHIYSSHRMYAWISSSVRNNLKIKTFII